MKLIHCTQSFQARQKSQGVAVPLLSVLAGMHSTSRGALQCQAHCLIWPLRAQMFFKVFNGYRPPIPEGTPRGLKDLMEMSWAHKPAERPSFRFIVRALQKLIIEVRQLYSSPTDVAAACLPHLPRPFQPGLSGCSLLSPGCLSLQQKRAASMAGQRDIQSAELIAVAVCSARHTVCCDCCAGAVQGASVKGCLACCAATESQVLGPNDVHEPGRCAGGR